MSVLIKGMEMPSNCNTCPILQTGYMEHCCPVLKEVMQGTDIVCERHTDCPLVDAPTPHGDLIDKDSVIELMLKHPLTNTNYCVSAKDICNISTIIEAEE